MTNSIRTEIELLQNTKYENRIAIMEKGVTVYGSDQYSIYPTRIGQISSTPGDKDTLMKSIIDRSITSIDIPNGTTKIKSQCFTDCTLLNTVTIPNTVTVIGNGAFRGCSSLTSVEIPSSVTELVGATFIDCTGLTSITFMSDTPPTLSGTPFDGSYPIYVPAASVTAYQTAWPQYASRIQAIQQPQYFVRVNSYSDFVLDTPILIVNENNDTALDCSQILNTTGATNGINATRNRSKSITIDANGKILADKTTLSYAGKMGATSAGYCLYYETNNTKHYIGILDTGRYGYNTTTAPSYTENIYGGTSVGVSYMVVYGQNDGYISNNNNFAVKGYDASTWATYTAGMAIYILQ